MRKGKSLLVLLVCVFILGIVATDVHHFSSAESYFPTGSGNQCAELSQTPTPTPSTLSDGTFSLQVDTGSGAHTLSTVMRYEQNRARGIFADGIVFMSARDYAMRPIFGAIPVEHLTGELKVIFQYTPGCSGSCSVGLYDGALDPVTMPEDGIITPDVLGDGAFLLTVPVSFNSDARSYSGIGFLWLIVGDDPSITSPWIRP